MSVMKSTQVLIAFQVEGDRESDLVSLLQTIAQIALLLWGFWQWGRQQQRQLKHFCQDCRQAARAAAAEITKLWSFELRFTFGVG